MKGKYNEVLKNMFVPFHLPALPHSIYCKNEFPTAYFDWESCVCNCIKFIRLLGNSGLAGKLTAAVLFVQLGVGVEVVPAGELNWFENTLN